MNDFSRPMGDPIFKGCTRPPMLAGVPMLWLLLSAGVVLLLFFYLLYGVNLTAAVGVGLCYAPFYLWMRAVTRLDDQRLMQMAKRAQSRGRQFAARRYWGAVTYVPLRQRR